MLYIFLEVAHIIQGDELFGWCLKSGGENEILES